MPTCFRIHLGRRGSNLVFAVVQSSASLQRLPAVPVMVSSGLCDVESCLPQKTITLLAFPPLYLPEVQRKRNVRGILG